MFGIIRISLASFLLVPFPVTFQKDVTGAWAFGVDYAYADKGRGRGGDDDRDNDRDDDRDDHRDDDRDDDRRDSRKGTISNPQSDSISDLHLQYSNKWDEQIRNNRYILTDPEGRVVSNRKATLKDLNRMRATAGY